MSMLTDPDMKEVVIEFCQESKDIFSELEEILDEYEEQASPDLLEKFGQTIDRVMGAAKNLEAHTLGTYCELGKTISYKAGQSDNEELLNIVIAVLFDMMDILNKLIQNVEDKQEESVQGISLEAFGKRLHWLSDKFKEIQRSSVAIDSEDLSQSDDPQASIDQLLADLGL